MILTRTAIEAEINNLPTSIANYKNNLQYSRSPVNYSFGDKLYMAPNDMVLHIDIINGYNNKIQTAGPDQKLGLNEDVNLKNTPKEDKSTSDNTDDSHKKGVPTTKSTLDENDNTDDSHNKDVPTSK